MAKKQGKVKAIPVKEVTEGMQVLCLNKYVGKVNHIDSDKGTHVGISYYCSSELKTLVVEYEDTQTWGIEGVSKTKQYLPLMYSQWQSAIDNGEIDSDKEVEFEIKDCVWKDTIEGKDTLVPTFQIAKIVPQKKRMYSEEEVEDICMGWMIHLQNNKLPNGPVRRYFRTLDLDKIKLS